jgi:predicted enzyme related to lactoylglutathione lyase
LKKTSNEGVIMPNVIVWADIPVADMDRARAFYSAVLQMPVEPIPGMEGIALPVVNDRDSVAFDLVKHETAVPSSGSGTTIYLGANGDIAGMAKRVLEAGGKILQPPTDMGEMVGVIAFFLDSEGNRLGIHDPHAA